ncbi:MAG: hypothetical protein ACI936_003380 [Paraglaciecola sp.]|jgi:hypothetical protein
MTLSTRKKRKMQLVRRIVEDISLTVRSAVDYQAVTVIHRSNLYEKFLTTAVILVARYNQFLRSALPPKRSLIIELV